MACSLLPCSRKLWMNLNSMHETRSKLQVQNDFFSTRIRCKRSPKTHPFKNSFQRDV